MPKFTNRSGGDLLLVGVGVIPAGGSTPELTADQAEGIRHQDIWAEETPSPADKEKKS